MIKGISISLRIGYGRASRILALVVMVLVAVRAQGIIMEIGANDPDQCETNGGSMDIHQGRNGVAWSPEIMVGGQTTSKNMVHGFTLNQGCYSHFIAFVKRITMSTNGGSITVTHERYFTDHVLYNSAPHYIGDIATVNFEFT